MHFPVVSSLIGFAVSSLNAAVCCARNSFSQSEGVRSCGPLLSALLMESVKIFPCIDNSGASMSGFTPFVSELQLNVPARVNQQRGCGSQQHRNELDSLSPHAARAAMLHTLRWPFEREDCMCHGQKTVGSPTFADIRTWAFGARLPSRPRQYHACLDPELRTTKSILQSSDACYQNRSRGRSIAKLTRACPCEELRRPFFFTVRPR